MLDELLRIGSDVLSRRPLLDGVLQVRHETLKQLPFILEQLPLVLEQPPLVLEQIKQPHSYIYETTSSLQ